MMGAGMAIGGAALSGAQLMASEDASAVAEREVIKVISGYARSFELSRNGERAEFKVKMRGPKQFAQAFDPERGLPFERIYVGEKNTLKFSHGGTDFTIVHLS